MKKTILTLFIVFITVTICNSQSVVIVAGIGTQGYSGNGSLAINAQLNYPRHLAFDNIGNMYFVEQGNHVLRKIDVNGVITTIAGTGTLGYAGDGGIATLAQLNSPRGLCIDNSGNIYISDTNNNVIRKINTSGIITTIVGNGVAGFSGDAGSAVLSQLNSPRGITIDSQGDLYIADMNNSRVRKVGSNNIISTYAGSSLNYSIGDGGQATMAGFVTPYDIEIYNNNVYVADIGAHNIRKINQSGVITTYTSSIASPSGLTFDSNGNLFITGLMGTLAKIDNLGIFSDILNSGLYLTSGVGFDNNNSLYLSDTANNQIKKIDMTVLNVIDQISNKEIVIYPNPTSDFLSVQIPNEISIDKIAISDLTGKVLLKQKEIITKIDVSNFKNGIYIIEVISGENSYFKKFVKN